MDGGVGQDAAPADAGDTTAPSIVDVTTTESPSSVLLWLVDVQTDEPATVTIEVRPADGDSSWTVQGGSDPATEHSVTVAGLRAETTYELTVEAKDAAGNTTTDSSASLTTSALPSSLPPMEVNTAMPERMAEGYTLFNVFQWPAGQNAPDNDTGWLFATDSAGELAWYAALDHRTDDAQILPNGNLVYVRPHEEVIEMDVTGEVQNRWRATALEEDPPAEGTGVDVDTFHHEIEMLPNGNMMALSTEMREITTSTCPNYSPSSGDSLNVVGDVVVEFEPDTGDVVQRVSMFDALDPCRRTDRGFKAGFWDSAYGGITTQDWTHGNAVFYDAERGIIVTSLRHQDWLVAFEYVPGEPSMSGDVAWILGAEGESGDYNGHPAFSPSGDPFEWPYHQHAPMYTDDGNLLVYDNGNLRPGTDFDSGDADGDGDLPYTRVVEYALDTSGDPSSWTATQTWDWRDMDDAGDTLYAPFVGDSDELDNGNVLIAHGGLLDPPSDGIRDPSNKKHARIVEVARDDPGEVVFDLTLRDSAETDFTGYTVYRAERVTGFPR
jgi:hypothetical protein